jgi:hypothetical protein
VADSKSDTRSDTRSDDKPDGSLFRRVLSRLRASDEELHDAELRERTVEQGCVAVAACLDRQRAKVHGTIRTVTLRPLAGVPALEAELWDGTGTVVLVFLGRRRIGGIEPGRALTAEGRVATVNGRPQLFNPFYTLTPAGA